MTDEAEHFSVFFRLNRDYILARYEQMIDAETSAWKFPKYYEQCVLNYRAALLNLPDPPKPPEVKKINPLLASLEIDL